MRQAYLQAMGIPSWEPKPAPQKKIKLIAAKSTTDPHFFDKITSNDAIWQVLEQLVHSCQHCDLYQTGQQPIFGEGNIEADLFIISQIESETEDQAAKLLIDEAGQLLLNMLFALGLKREQIYLTSGIKCFNKKKDLSAKQHFCFTWLNRQVELVKPKIILVLGRLIAEQLMNYQHPFETLQQSKQTFLKTNIPMIISYHPQDLLDNSKLKVNTWRNIQHISPYLHNTLDKI